MVVLDTNIIIDHLRTTHKKSTLLRIVEKYPKQTLCLSLISLQELYEGQSTRIPEKEKDLLSTISPLKILPYSYEVAQHAGIIARDLKQPIELADAAIAATAILNHAQLCTLNQKDFSGVPGIELFPLSEIE